MAQLRANVRTTVANELVYVCNTALSADRVPLWDSEAQELTLRRVRAGLMLGLDALSSAPGVEGDAEVLGRVPVALIFRTGYARTLDAARLALKSRRRGLLVGPGGPLDALDQPLLKTWTEALTDRHPHLPGDRTPRTAEDLSRMRGFAEVVGSLVDFPGGGRPETAGLCAWVLTQLVRDVLGLEDSGPLPLSHLATAHRALFADGAVTETARAAIFAAAERKGLVHRPTVEFLLAWAAEELAQQTPENLEARFCAPLVLGP